MFRLTDPPLREQVRNINWLDVAFWVAMFLAIYFWPTEGRGQTKPHFKSGVVAKPPPELTLDVVPKFVIPNPFKSQTFRIRWRVEPHPDNRKYRFESECDGGEASISEGEIDSITMTIFRDYRGGPCHFSICVIRSTGKRICRQQEVNSPSEVQ